MRKYAFYVVRTAFHGGGIVSRHTTRELAEAAARRYASKDCSCGCCGVVAAADYASLPNISSSPSPYALAAR